MHGRRSLLPCRPAANDDGVRVTAEITSLRLADIAFDSKTLRVIAEAEGMINVDISVAAGIVI